MAVTLEQLQQQRDELVARIGVSRLQFGDRAVEYSRAQEALALIDAEIAKLSPPSSNVFTITTGRGLDAAKE